MFVWSIFFSIFFKLIFFFYTYFKDIFVNWVNFTSHSAFIGCNFISLDKNSVSWDFHTLVDLNYISHKDKVLMNFNEMAIPNHWDSFPLINNRIQFNKLSFLLVIIHRSHSGRYEYCNHNSKPLNPCNWSMVGFSCRYLDSYWNYTSHHKDS